MLFSQAPEDLGGQRWGGASKDGRVARLDQADDGATT